MKFIFAHLLDLQSIRIKFVYENNESDRVKVTIAKNVKCYPATLTLTARFPPMTAARRVARP